LLYVLFVLIVLFCVLFMCKSILYYCHGVSTQLQLTNISYHIVYQGHCSTSRKVAGSIPDGVIGIFHLRNLSGRTMAPWLTQPLTEMSNRNVSWG